MAVDIKGRQAARNLAKALSHPVRSDVLTILSRREASPVEMKNELNQEIYDGKLETSHVDYHVRQLLKLECIELVSERPVRGATEHFYRATIRSILDLPNAEDLPLPTVYHYYGGVLRYVLKDLLAAAEGGSLEKPEDVRLMSDRPVIDRQGYDRVLEIAERAWGEIEEEQRRSVNRLKGSDEASMTFSIAQLCFAMPVDDAEEQPPTAQET